MVTEDIARKVFDVCLSTGADFAELFVENTYQGRITYSFDHVDKISSNEVYGAGIRILEGTNEVYGYTNDLSIESLVSLAEKLKDSFKGVAQNIEYKFKEEFATGPINIKRLSKDISYDEKIPYLKTVYNTIKSTSDLIVYAEASLQEYSQCVTIFNTFGKFIHDKRNQQRIQALAVASKDDIRQQATNTIGGNFDLDAFKSKDLVQFAKDVANQALIMLDAPLMVGGVYPVVMHNAFGGVLFHEACGHSLEATSVALGLSVFSKMKNKKIASDILTAIDDGTISDEWGSTNIDDEGNKSQRNILIKDGILTSYMVDYKNGLIMHEKPTGNSRRESYKYSPTSRMTNTFIANGEYTFDDIIKSTKYGLFAKKLGGGSVNPITGEFNFAVNEGYMIENGKITHPVRGATLIGNGKDALMHIDAIANNQTFGHGVCGAKSGSICANVGEPTIRILNMTVGGAGGNK